MVDIEVLELKAKLSGLELGEAKGAISINILRTGLTQAEGDQEATKNLKLELFEAAEAINKIKIEIKAIKDGLVTRSGVWTPY